MPFSEKIKQKVKEHAHFKCCVCRKYSAVHVHHIIPQADSGTDEEDNAAPLCANCHDLLGGNPEKRKFIKDNRDFWYAMCEKQYPADYRMIHEMHEHLCKEVVTKTDLDNALKPLYEIITNKSLSHSEQIQHISDVTAAISDAIIEPSINICPDCGFRYDINESTCPRCSWPDNRYD